MENTQDKRDVMVREQLLPRGIRDPHVLEAMRRVPREAFVPQQRQPHAYDDCALPIGAGQTISQPLMVAEMIEAARVGPGDKVLEVGAGCGYAAAVLGQIAKHVYAIERNPDLGKQAAERLQRLGYRNIDLRIGDGSLGLPEAAPFDAIVVSAGGPAVPEALLQQLAIGGHLVMPTGLSHREQELVAVERDRTDHYHWKSLGMVRFVPLIGEGGWKDTSGRD